MRSNALSGFILYRRAALIKEAVVFAAQPGVRVITGMNLTLVATLLTEEELPLDELVKTSIAEAQASIQQPEFVSKEEDF